MANLKTLRIVVAVSVLVAGCTKRYDGKTVNEWIHQLETGEASDQRAAVDALGKIGPPAREALPRLMSTAFPSDYSVLDLSNRVWAVERILTTDDPKAMEAMAFALGNGSGIRVTIMGGDRAFDIAQVIASMALAKKGKTAVPLLVKALKSSSADAREVAAIGLVEMGPPAAEAAAALEEASRDPDERVRRKALEAVAAIGKRE